MLNQTETNMPWSCPEFTAAVENLLRVYWENTPYTPETWRPGVITQVNLEMCKDGKARADICLKLTGE